MSRASAARTVSAELGMHAGTAWEDLPARFGHVLATNGITPAKWDALRTATRVAENGNTYITPDLMRGLDEATIEHMVADRMAGVKTTDPAKIEAARQGFLADARLELELDVGRFVNDEVSNAILEPDAKTRRIMLQGTRPGTAAGEAARFIMQFKSFSIAAGDRLGARALFGGAGDTKPEHFTNNLPHTGAMIFGLTTAGYMGIVAKDMLRGKWPPRDPGDPKTWAAAMVQGGGAGVYGDFLFGEANRFGNGPLETAAGPALGAAAGAVSLLQKARAGDAKAADGLNLILQNTPFLNLWWSRPALDALVLNRAREWASPGFLYRRSRQLRKETGQEYVFPR